MARKKKEEVITESKIIVEEKPKIKETPILQVVTYDEVYLDENGLPVFRDNIEGTNLVMKFNIDEKFADEKAAKDFAEEYGWNIGLDFYKK